MTVDTKQLEQDGESFTLGAKRDIVKVQSLVDEYLILQERIAKGEALLRQLKEQVRELEWVKLPAVMIENGVKKIAREDGIVVEVKDEITGSIPENKRDEAIQWLRDNGHGGIVARVISLNFKKGEEPLASKVWEVLGHYAPELTQRLEEKATVNHMTLKAWAREMVSRGTALPTELLGLFIGQRAKIQFPKEQ